VSEQTPRGIRFFGEWVFRHGLPFGAFLRKRNGIFLGFAYSYTKKHIFALKNTENADFRPKSGSKTPFSEPIRWAVSDGCTKITLKSKKRKIITIYVIKW